MPKKQKFNYSRRKVRSKGIKDGRDWKWRFWPFEKTKKAPQPAPDQATPAIFEEEILRTGEQDLGVIAHDWDEADLKLLPRYCHALVRRSRLKKEHQEDTEDKMKTEAVFEKVKKELDAFEEPSLSHSFEWTILIFIALLEIPVNAVILSIFGASKNETYGMAIGIAFLISVMAYLFGRALKMHPKNLSDKVLLVIAPIIMIGVLVGLSIIRASLFDAVQQFEIIKINLDPNTAAVIFVAINFALFLAAMLVTYAATRPDHRQYKTVKKRYLDARKAYRRALKEYEETWEELADAEEALMAARNKRTKVFEAFCEEARAKVETVEWLVSVYRAANMEARLDGKEPECFRTPPRDMEVPYSLHEKTLSWDCENLPQFLHSAN